MRHKNLDWNLPAGNPTHQWESIHAAILMDIRDELQALNRLLACPNFIGIPSTLRDIKLNTTKARKTKKRKVKPLAAGAASQRKAR